MKPLASPLDSPENRIILACGRASLDQGWLEVIDTALDDISDWPLLTRHAETHGLLPLVAWHLRQNFISKLPSNAEKLLRDGFVANSIHALQFTQELVSVINLFSVNSITALAYKGPTLAETVYASVGLRVFRDLDIFVREEDFGLARHLLEERGYRSAYSLTPARRSALCSSGNHELLIDTKGSRVELHWKTTKKTYPFPLDHNHLWNRATPVKLGDASILSIALEDLLLMLAVHGSSHGWSRLEWVATYGELLRQSVRTDWNLVFDRAISLGIRRVLVVAIELASIVVDAPHPEGYVYRLQPTDRERSVARGLAQSILAQTASSFARVVYQFAIRETTAERVKLACTSLFSPSHEDWAVVDLPDRLYPLYYAVRPVRLVASYVR